MPSLTMSLYSFDGIHLAWPIKVLQVATAFVKLLWAVLMAIHLTTKTNINYTLMLHVDSCCL